MVAQFVCTLQAMGLLAKGVPVTAHRQHTHTRYAETDTGPKNGTPDEDTVGTGMPPLMGCFAEDIALTSGSGASLPFSLHTGTNRISSEIDPLSL